MSTPIRKSDIDWRLLHHITNQVNHNSISNAHSHARGTYNKNEPAHRANALWYMGSAIPIWREMLTAGSMLCQYWAQATYAMFGITGNVSPAYTSYATFIVDPDYHRAHYNAVVNDVVAITTYANQGIMNLGVVSSHYYLMIEKVTSRINRLGDVPDIRVCHGSCHTNCHQSRGRR